jgi:tRNA(Ile)-lysidine synthase
MDSSDKEQAQGVSQKGRGADNRARKRLSAFADSLLKEWKRLALPVRGERTVVVAVSGGADSVALVLALNELTQGGQMSLGVRVAHLNHGLRGETGSEDARFVEKLAEGLRFEFVTEQADVRERAAQTGDNLEQAARRVRHEFLAQVAKECGARLVLMGHTMNDQAETVLLRLLRGSGAEGLGAMQAVRELAETSGILLARPMLSWARRVETEKYCRERGVEFRTDEMNADEEFSRVRVRRRLLPLMAEFNPRVVESLSRTAELLREDAAFVKLAASELLTSAREAGKAENERGASALGSLSVDILAGAPRAVCRRALRLWIAEGRGDLRRLELVHLNGIEKLLTGERGGRRAELPGGSFVERRRGRLWFLEKRNSESRSQNPEERRNQ